MPDNQNTLKLLRSIKNALWMIVAILLIQCGFHLEGLKSAPFAEVFMIGAFWAGFFLIVHVLAGMVIAAFERPETKDEKTGSSDGGKD